MVNCVAHHFYFLQTVNVRWFIRFVFWLYRYISQGQPVLSLIQQQYNTTHWANLLIIGGWNLHIYGHGHNNDNGPTVIFENGIRGFSFDWITVQQKIASFAKSYSYDRAGYAWSNLDQGHIPCTNQFTTFILY